MLSIAPSKKTNTKAIRNSPTNSVNQMPNMNLAEEFRMQSVTKMQNKNDKI